MSKKISDEDAARIAAGLPHVKAADRNRIEDALTVMTGARRPPVVHAGWLALIMELDKAGLPYPPRRAVAVYLNSTKDGVDSAKNTSLARGLVVEKVSYIDGNIQQRESVVKQQHFVPTRKLLHAIGTHVPASQQARPRFKAG